MLQGGRAFCMPGWLTAGVEAIVASRSLKTKWNWRSNWSARVPKRETKYTYSKWCNWLPGFTGCRFRRPTSVQTEDWPSRSTRMP